MKWIRANSTHHTYCFLFNTIINSVAVLFKDFGRFIQPIKPVIKILLINIYF
jgi:hypothetical protein